MTRSAKRPAGRRLVPGGGVQTRVDHHRGGVAQGDPRIDHRG